MKKLYMLTIVVLTIASYSNNTQAMTSWLPDYTKQNPNIKNNPNLTNKEKKKLQADMLNNMVADTANMHIADDASGTIALSKNYKTPEVIQLKDLEIRALKAENESLRYQIELLKQQYATQNQSNAIAA